MWLDNRIQGFINITSFRSKREVRKSLEQRARNLREKSTHESYINQEALFPISFSLSLSLLLPLSFSFSLSIDVLWIILFLFFILSNATFTLTENSERKRASWYGAWKWFGKILREDVNIVNVRDTRGTRWLYGMGKRSREWPWLPWPWQMHLLLQVRQLFDSCIVISIEESFKRIHSINT